MTTNPPTDQQLDDIEAKAAELRQKTDRKNSWPSDNESHWHAEGWKSGTRNALDKLHVEQLVAEVRRLRADAWVPCSPAWIAANPGQCPTAPRVPGPEGVSHLHPAVLGEGVVDEMAASLARDGFGDDEIADMLGPGVTDGEAPEPTLLRWGLDDVMWGDDDSVIVMMSGPGREPYWLELDPERAAVLRQSLAGPDGEQPPTERAAVLRDFLFRLEQSAGDAAAEKFLDDNPDLSAALETHVVADDSDDPEHVDDCPGCEPGTRGWTA
jgi:hypothetical protein